MDSEFEELNKTRWNGQSSNVDPDMCDMSERDLKTLPTIPSSYHTQLKYLFLNDNLSLHVSNLSYLSHLLVLDLSYCQLSTIPQLPSSLEEINLAQNKLTCIAALSRLPRLKRLDCTLNQLTIFPSIPTLTHLVISSNQISTIPPHAALKSLSCGHNALGKIPQMPLLETLDCDHNMISQIEPMELLSELYCDSNQLSELGQFPNLRILHCCFNPIKRVRFYPRLTELFTNCNSSYMNKRYAINTVRIFERHTRSNPTSTDVIMFGLTPPV